MATMNITDSKAKQLEQVETEALNVIQKALEIGAVDDHTNLAIKTANMVAKNRQSVLHSEAVRFGMASMIADETELKRYVLATEPSIGKLLKSK